MQIYLFNDIFLLFLGYIYSKNVLKKIVQQAINILLNC